MKLLCLAPFLLLPLSAATVADADMDEACALQLRGEPVAKPNAEGEEEPADQYGHHDDERKERMPHVDTYSGRNLAIDYTYNFKTDCYGDGSGKGYECPEGSWCQVSTRPNWYPWDVSYMERGRCLQYQPIGGACEEAYEGETSFPRKANGEFFSRPVHCAPDAICTGEGFSKVLPPMCTLRRDPKRGCMSSKPFCAGRPLEGGCPPEHHDFCICPQGSTEGSCDETSQVTKTKLEQCGSVFNSMNGPNFAFVKGMDHTGLPNDNNIEAGTHSRIFKLPLEHGQNPDIGNSILRRLWPYPVCSDEDTEKKGCTPFPLPVLVRDNDGGIVGNYTNGENATWVPKDGRGVVDYHCTWMMMHTLSFNGNPVLTLEEEAAFADMVMYISGQFDCKVCRNHFVHIIEMYGLPTGNLRETYARWLWRAHNIANEHTYATHSPDDEQLAGRLNKNPKWTPKDRRSSMWGNPNYEHPWYMSFSDAAATWSGVV